MPSENKGPTDEEKVADFLVRTACSLNKQCENRVEGNNHVHAYSGYAVDMPSLESAILHHFKSSWAKRAAQVYMTEQPRY